MKYKLLILFLLATTGVMGQAWSSSPAVTTQTRIVSGSGQIRWLWGSTGIVNFHDTLQLKYFKLSPTAVQTVTGFTIPATTGVKDITYLHPNSSSTHDGQTVTVLHIGNSGTAAGFNSSMFDLRVDGRSRFSGLVASDTLFRANAIAFRADTSHIAHSQLFGDTARQTFLTSWSNHHIIHGGATGISAAPDNGYSWDEYGSAKFRAGLNFSGLSSGTVVSGGYIGVNSSNDLVLGSIDPTLYKLKSDSTGNSGFVTQYGLLHNTHIFVGAQTFGDVAATTLTMGGQSEFNARTILRGRTDITDGSSGTAFFIFSNVPLPGITWTQELNSPGTLDFNGVNSGVTSGGIHFSMANSGSIADNSGIFFTKAGSDASHVILGDGTYGTYSGGGSGTLTTISGVNTNGFTWSIANPTTTPAITLTLQNATTSQSGQLTATDWNTFNGKQAAGSYLTSVSGTTNRITSTGGTTPVIDISSTFEALLGKVANPLSQFASTTSAQLAGVLSDESGSGVVAYTVNPVFTTPNLGTPSTLVGTNITGAAAGFTAGNVTTNANLTGPITSVGNATTITSSVALPGSPTTTTQTTGDNTTKIATDAFVNASITTAAGSYVPYTGATTNVNLGTNFIAAGASLTPLTAIHAISTGTSTPRGILSDQNSANTSGARITMRKSRGTPGTPTVITMGDVLGSWTAAGHDGTNYIDAGKVLVTSTGTIGTGIVPSIMELQTMTAAGALADGIKIDQAQALTFGAYTTGIAHLGGSGAVTSSAVNLAGADVTGLLPNSNLANSTISGVSLGGTLAPLTNGVGVLSLNYTGASTLPIIIDTANIASHTYTNRYVLQSQTIAGFDLRGPITLAALTAGTGITLPTNYTGATARNISINQNALLNWTNLQTFQAGINTSGNITGAATGNNTVTSITGANINTAAANYTDNSTAAGVTIGFTSPNVIGIPTITASLATSGSKVTYTNPSTLTILGIPVAGTNTLLTTPIAINVVAGAAVLNGGLYTFTGANTTSNIGVSGGQNAASSSTSGLQFGGATSIMYRAIFNGTSSTNMATGQSYSNVIVGSSPISTFSSGTQAYLANLVVNKLGTVTNGGATTTNSVSFGVFGQSAGGTNKYVGLLYDDAGVGTNNTWFKYGITRVSGLTIDSLTSITTAPTTSAGTPDFLTRNTSTGVIEKIPNSSIPTTQASADLTAQSAAGNVTTFTVGASTATFNISSYINVTAVSVDVIQGQITYTDENNTAQTISLSSLSAIGNSTYSPTTIRAKNATVITVKTNLTTGAGSITFDTGARITQL